MKRHKTRRKTLTIPSKNTKQNKSQDKHHTKPKKKWEKKGGSPLADRAMEARRRWELGKSGRERGLGRQHHRCQPLRQHTLKKKETEERERERESDIKIEKRSYIKALKFRHYLREDHYDNCTTSLRPLDLEWGDGAQCPNGWGGLDGLMRVWSTIEERITWQRAMVCYMSPTSFLFLFYF